MLNILHTVLHILLYLGGACGVVVIGGSSGVMVIVVGNGHGDTSSNPGRN